MTILHYILSYIVPRNRGVQQDGVKECAEMRERCGRSLTRHTLTWVSMSSNLYRLGVADYVCRRLGGFLVRCGAVPCRVVLCDVVLCRAVLCCAVCCGDVRSGDVRCRAVRCCVVLCVLCCAVRCGDVLLCYAVRAVLCVLCRVVMCYVCCAVPCDVVLCCAVL